MSLVNQNKEQNITQESHQENKSLTDNELLIAAFEIMKRNKEEGHCICTTLECKDCPFFDTKEGEDEDCINDWLILFNNKRRQIV